MAQFGSYIGGKTFIERDYIVKLNQFLVEDNKEMLSSQSNNLLDIFKVKLESFLSFEGGEKFVKDYFQYLIDNYNEIDKGLELSGLLFQVMQKLTNK